MIDLHSHSYCSDGELSPEALVSFAASRGISQLALTDHDTLSGLDAAVAQAKKDGIRLIAGVEITAKWLKHDLHVVALNIDYKQPALNAFINNQLALREQRAVDIATKLASIGISDTLHDAKQLAGTGAITRPHFAHVLIERGLCRDMAGAFKHYLRRGRPAFAPTHWPDLAVVIQTIREAGGQAVLAHPARYKLTMTKLKQLLTTFKAVGGEGMEVVAGQACAKEIKLMGTLCHEFDLLASLGSDFHSRQSAPIMMGRLAAMPSLCRPIWLDWEGK